MINLLTLLPQSSPLSQDLSEICLDDVVICACKSFDEVRTRLNAVSDCDSTFVLIDEASFDLEGLSFPEINAPFTVAYAGNWLQVMRKIGASRFFTGIWGESSTDGVPYRDRTVLQTLLQASCKKQLPNFLSFFSADKVRTVEKIVRNNDDKRESLKEMEDFVVSLGADDEHRFQRYATKASEAVDEMLLNAIWDANPALFTKSRDSNFALSPVEEITVRWAFDGDLFGCAVCDPFGRLEKASIVRHLTAETADLGPFLERKSGGLGIKRIFERSHHVVASVRRGVLTEIQCFMRFEKRLRDFQKVPKSLHYFVEGEVRQ